MHGYIFRSQKEGPTSKNSLGDTTVNHLWRLSSYWNVWASIAGYSVFPSEMRHCKWITWRLVHFMNRRFWSWFTIHGPPGCVIPTAGHSCKLCVYCKNWSECFKSLGVPCAACEPVHNNVLACDKNVWTALLLRLIHLWNRNILWDTLS
jgi:hypothetical protein